MAVPGRRAGQDKMCATQGHPLVSHVSPGYFSGELISTCGSEEPKYLGVISNTFFFRASSRGAAFPKHWAPISPSGLLPGLKYWLNKSRYEIIHVCTPHLQLVHPAALAWDCVLQTPGSKQRH